MMPKVFKNFFKKKNLFFNHSVTLREKTSFETPCIEQNEKKKNVY